jgi:hypothetical protein
MRNALMETTVPGVFAVGDGAGISGAPVAEEEGRVAGITAAEQAGLLSTEKAARRRTRALERLRSLRQLRAALDKAVRPSPGPLDLATPQTLVCRCEEVSLADVQAALDQGARDLQTVKLLTRLGMGACQGRNCAPAMGPYLRRATGRTADEVGRINPRPPTTPVPLGTLAGIVEAGES